MQLATRVPYREDQRDISLVQSYAEEKDGLNRNTPV